MTTRRNQRRLERLESQVVVVPHYWEQALWWLAVATLRMPDGSERNAEQHAAVLFAAQRGDREAIAEVREAWRTDRWAKDAPQGLQLLGDRLPDEPRAIPFIDSAPLS